MLNILIVSTNNLVGVKLNTMKKIYYVVTVELNYIDGYGETTGNKNIMVYEIIDNILNQIGSFDVELDSVSENEVLDWIDTDVYGDEINLIQL